MTFLRRISLALLLLILAPFTAEFLLGDFSVRQLALLLVLLPMYGGGALLIREIVRRAGRGWPSILLLGVAYALIEEGFTTQSLFNPNYAGARLLDYGYVPALGTSLDWSVFVLSIHVVWSIATPILIAEGVAGERRTTPWLKWPGLCFAAVLYGFGCLITTRYSLETSPFRASSGELFAVGVLSLVAIVAAFVAFRRAVRLSRSGKSVAPAAWIVAVVCFALSSAVHLLRSDSVRGVLPAAASVVVMLVLEAIAVVLIAIWARRERWTATHYLAIATGTVLTYAWVGLGAFLSGHTNLGAPTGALDDIGQIIEILVVLGVVVLAKRALPASE